MQHPALAPPAPSSLDRFTRAAPAPTIVLLAFLLPVPQHGAIGRLPSVCLFHYLTGLPCPGCGLTRAVVCTAHGLWREAIFYHPLGPLFFAAFLGIALLPLAKALWPQCADLVPLRLKSLFYHGTMYVTGFLLLGIWIGRLAGYLPSPP